MVDLAPLSPEWRDSIRDRYHAAVFAAIESGVSEEIAGKLRNARQLGFELTSIMSGNPRANSVLLQELVNRLDRLAIEFDALADELDRANSHSAFHIHEVFRYTKDLTAWVHYPEVEEKPAKNVIPKKRRHRANVKATTPLTPKQAEVLQIVGECRGNIAQAARQLGRDRKTVEETYKAATAKMGKTAVKAMTKKMSTDLRGQSNISEDRRR